MISHYVRRRTKQPSIGPVPMEATLRPEHPKTGIIGSFCQVWSQDPCPSAVSPLLPPAQATPEADKAGGELDSDNRT